MISVYVFSERNFSLNLSITWLKSFKSPFKTAVDKEESDNRDQYKLHQVHTMCKSFATVKNSGGLLW